MRAHALVVAAAVLTSCGDGSNDARPDPVVHQATQELRPTDTNAGLMWHFATGETVESFGADGGSYLVHFTRAGVNAVPVADADDSGVPDFVEVVDATYEQVGALYHGPLGYRRPVSDGTISNNGGDARFDIYLVDFARSADGAFRVDQCQPTSPNKCIGYVVQENDFVNYGYPSTTIANRILASHEYFHAVQSAYDDAQNVVVSEGTAVWATERFDPTTNDFEGFIHGYLERTDRSIDSAPPGPVPTFAYGSAIFFKFLTERHDDALMRKLWEHLENGQGDATEPMDQADPTFVVQLDALLKRDYNSSFAAEWAEFAKWNLFTSTAADAAQGYAEGFKYPLVTTTTVTMPHQVDGLRVFYASTQYFTAPANGRTLVTAALVDSQLTTTDDLSGMALWLVARKGGRNTEVVRVTNGEVVDVSGGSAIIAVTNTNRGAIGASLSQRPGVCLGTVEEVNACIVALGGTVATDGGVDGGNSDAGSMDTDAGMVTDAGTGGPNPPTGCGCGVGIESSPLWLLLLALGRRWFRFRR
ncbi:MAG: hypothetical protein QM817_09575 [Archangium sp.]